LEEFDGLVAIGIDGIENFLAGVGHVSVSSMGRVRR
jgi:hypothetical protein